MTGAEVARCLKLSPATVSRMIRDGGLRNELELLRSQGKISIDSQEVRISSTELEQYQQLCRLVPRPTSNTRSSRRRFWIRNQRDREYASQVLIERYRKLSPEKSNESSEKKQFLLATCHRFALQCAYHNECAVFRAEASAEHRRRVQEASMYGDDDYVLGDHMEWGRNTPLQYFEMMIGIDQLFKLTRDGFVAVYGFAQIDHCLTFSDRLRKVDYGWPIKTLFFVETTMTLTPNFVKADKVTEFEPFLFELDRDSAALFTDNWESVPTEEHQNFTDAELAAYERAQEWDREHLNSFFLTEYEGPPMFEELKAKPSSEGLEWPDDAHEFTEQFDVQGWYWNAPKTDRLR